MTGILIFILVITLVIAIHEYGHYLACRMLGIPVEKFAIGFGKPLLKHTSKGGTEWSLRPIPLGGYVQPETTRMENAPPLAKFIVAIAGPAANILPFAVGAALIGKFTAFMSLLWTLYVMTLVAVFNLITFGVFAAEKVKPEEAVTGPIGMVSMTANMPHGPGMTFVMLFVALSIGIGLINLAPIPVLDGGHAIMAGVEAGVGRKRADKIRKVANVVGVVIILMIFIISTVTDIGNLF